VDQFVRVGDGPAVIMVGVDGSPTSLHAGANAAGMARRQGARLVFVYVAPRASPLFAEWAPEVYASSENTVNEVADDVRQQVEAGVTHFGVAAEFRAERGDAFTALARIADELHADSVVVGASTKAGHRLVGSLAVRLVRAGRWPVTVVP
jgi:nucleotide-binding universal stress UspA family protein